MGLRYATTAACSLAALLSATSAMAEAAPSYRDTTLTGNWAGYRDAAATAGITSDIVYKYDVMGVVSGGLETGWRQLDNLDVIVGFDNEKLLGIKGNSAMLQLLSNTGQEVDGSLIGSIGVVNNIEVTTPTAKLYQAFVQQNFWDDSLSLLVGLYDANSEFNVTASSLIFLHSAFGVNTELGISGITGPSIFPSTSFGARVGYSWDDKAYLRFAVLDGVAGDPQNQKGQHVFRKLGGSDGALLMAEAGYTPQPNTKLALGGWRYTEEYDHLSQVGATGAPLRESSDGLYVMAEHRLYTEKGSETKGLDAFIRAGFANDDVIAVDYSLMAGATYTGLIPTRDEGVLGLAIAEQHLGDAYRSTGAYDSAETVWELTYSDPLTPWLTLQPDAQYVINPSVAPNTDDAWVVGTRFIVNF